MKRLIPFAFLCIVLHSCVTFKMYDNETKKMRLPEYEVLVVKTNGEKIAGKKLKWGHDKSIAKDVSLIIDGNPIPIGEIYAYQDEKSYYRRFQSYWARLLRRGKINLYYYEIYNGVSDRAERGYYDHFVFEKNNGELKELTKREISEWLADNSTAQNKFNSIFKKGDVFIYRQMRLDEIVSIIDMYNQ